MTVYKQLLQAVSGIVLTAVFIAPGHAELPENSYACHVQTKGGSPGLVTVQAHSMESAKKIALRVEALKMDGTYAPVTSLIQCIQWPEGRFSDPQFQKFYKNLPG